MTNFEEQDLLPVVESDSNSLTLSKESNSLTEKIVTESDPTKLEDLTKLFTINQQKKDIIRANRLSNLLELVDSEVITRFTTTPEEFNNDQLLKYMDSTQKAISSINQSLNQTPVIQINNQKNEININNSGLNRESRSKVLEAVMSILNNNVIDVEEGEEECEEI